MSDQTYISLKIGGTISRANAEQLAEMLGDEDWCNTETDQSDILEHMIQATNSGQPLYFEADEVNYGEPPTEIVEFLKENKMSFTLHWGQGSDFSTGMRHMDSSGEEFGLFVTHGFHDEPMFTKKKIEEILGDGPLTKDERSKLIQDFIDKINGEGMVFQMTND